LSGWLNPKFQQLKIPSQPETIFVSQPAETKLTALNFFVKPKTLKILLLHLTPPLLNQRELNKVLEIVFIGGKQQLKAQKNKKIQL
jgi:hypothetical protein